jgi:hypothetical protein
LLGNIRRKAGGSPAAARLASLEYHLCDYRGIIDIDFLVGFVGGRMREMNQGKALGISLKAFAVLIVAVCFIYEMVTPSVKFMTLWFSYLVGAALYAIGVLISFL